MPRERPNILILFTDQHRHDALSCAGNGKIRTPNLDALATSGVRFTSACTPTPICVAARMSLITGHRMGRTRVPANHHLPGPRPELPTLMTLLSQEGYCTHAVGKMHFRGRHYGLHRHERMEEGVQARIDDDYLMYLKKVGIRTRYPHGLRDLLYFQPQTSGTPVEHSPNNWVADRAIAFLREHARYREEAPFLLWASWVAPHPPFAPVEPYDSMYDPGEMDLPVCAERPATSLPSQARGHRARLDGAHLDPDRIRRIRALYYGQVSHIDDSVGRVIAELAALELEEDTVVLFTSDHGDMLGDHGLSQKNVPYEPSVRIPFLMRWPGRTEAGKVSDDLVGLTDVLPTFVDELGLEYPAESGGLPGASLLSSGGGGLASSRETYVIDYGHDRSRWLAGRTRTHKYTYWPVGRIEELFDLEEDPDEANNIAPEQPEMVEEFRAQLLERERRHGFTGSLDGEEFRSFPAPPPPSEEPRGVVVNEGPWSVRLPEDERGTVETYAEAFTRAIQKESSLSPGKLSLGQHKEKGGQSLAGTPWEDAWREA